MRPKAKKKSRPARTLTATTRRRLVHSVIDVLSASELKVAANYLLAHYARYVEDFVDGMESKAAIKEAEEKGYVSFDQLKADLDL